jgi:DNA topoisomerase I
MTRKVRLSHRRLLDHKETASTARLIYITNTTPGIRRLKKGKGFSYIYNDNAIKDKEILTRIKKLVIPPSWSDVWICASPTGHIQATGLDMLKRKQYRYHAAWNALRSETKFHRLFEFGKVLPQLRRQTKKDIRQKELSEKKIIATVINLMEETYIRIGNNGYEKMYGSYGLTTLKNRHVTIQGDKIRFCFIGKKGIEHTITLKNKNLARIVKQCRDIPGKELFQYYDNKGNKKSIDSGMVNDYLKENTGGMDVSAKDFRTWAGTLQALKSFAGFAETPDPAELKKNILQMLDNVSAKLGNTRTVCRKYYIHPELIRLYEENKLPLLLKNAAAMKSLTPGLTKEEASLITILKKCPLRNPPSE